MRAVVYSQYGPPDVLTLQEVEKPTPAENQILVKVHASSVNAKDYRMRGGRPFLMRFMIGGVFRPRETRVGSDVAGRVEAVGPKVTKFRPGDEVFGCTSGAFAEYVLAREPYLALKPANVSFADAAAVPVAGLTALQGLRHAGGVQAGQKVLIQGASGGVGSFAVQLAKIFGAEVTAVCSTRNLDMARSIGADHVIDYTREDFTRSQQCYDLIFAANGYHSLGDYQRVLCPQGVYVCAGGTLPQMFQAMLLGPRMSKKGGRQMSSMGIARVVQEDLVYLGQLLESGQLTPLIDRQYPLSDCVEAFRYVEGTHPQGKVVVTID